MTTTNHPTWQLSSPIDAVIFDCDGTLSQLEGIDEVARKNGVYEEVSCLTAEAMTRSGMSIELYSKRLALVKPSQQQTIDVGHEYYEKCNPDICAVINLLQQQQKTVFIVSGGLLPSVKILGNYLNIPEQNIYAVDLHFDSAGNYLDFDRQSPLVTHTGKHDVVSAIKKSFPRLAYVGDGLNDFAAYQLVKRFIGYGGAFYRQSIAAMCEYYIKSPNMASIVPLLLTEEEAAQLTKQDYVFYQKGLQQIAADEVLMQTLHTQQITETLTRLGFQG